LPRKTRKPTGADVPLHCRFSPGATASGNLLLRNDLLRRALSEGRSLPWRNHGQEISRPAGSGRSPQHDDRRPGGPGSWAGATGGYQLSRPSRSDPERPPAVESRRSTSSANRYHPDRAGRDRTPSSPPSPSRRPRLRPRRTASASSPPPPSSSSPPSSWVLKRKGVHWDALFATNGYVNSGAFAPRGRSTSPVQKRPRRGAIWKKPSAAKLDFSPRIPSRPKPSPNPNRTTTNRGEMFRRS
jgi:hypothetical protein